MSDRTFGIVILVMGLLAARSALLHEDAFTGILAGINIAMGTSTVWRDWARRQRASDGAPKAR